MAQAVSVPRKIIVLDVTKILETDDMIQTPEKELISTYELKKFTFAKTYKNRQTKVNP